MRWSARGHGLRLLTALFVLSVFCGQGIFPRFADLHFDVAAEHGRVIVRSVAPASAEAAAGLIPGMQLLAINGHKIKNLAQVQESQIYWLWGGGPVRLSVASGAGSRLITYRAERGPVPWGRWVFIVILALYFFCGVYILLQRWDSPSAFWFGWTMTLIGLLEAQVALPRWIAMWETRGHPLATVFRLVGTAVAGLLLPAVVYLIFRAMGSMFSGAEGQLRRSRWAGGYLGLLAVTVAFNEAAYFSPSFPNSTAANVAAILIGVCFLTALFGARLLYHRAKNFHRDVRTQRLMNILRWAAWVSFVPPLVAETARALIGAAPASRVGTIIEFLPLTLALYPLVVAWAISRQRLFGFQGLLRRSLQYAFLSGGLGVAYYVPLAVFGFMIGNAGAGAGWLAGGILGMAATIVGGRLTRRRLHAALDRRFFREAYEAEQVLGNLGSQMGRYWERGALEAFVLEQMDAALHLSWAGVYESGAPDAPAQLGQYRVAGEGVAGRNQKSLPPPQVLTPPPEAGGAAASERTLVYQPAPASRGGHGTRAGDEAWNGAEAAVGLRSHETWLGWMLLGPKLSEEPFTKRDLGLIAAVASQLAASLANVRLVAEVRKRDRISQELLMAREVQQRLLPQALPAVEGLDLAVEYAPAREVGGDYYDVFELEPGVVTLVVADVAGKGFSAALLMANLQALVRGAQARSAPLEERVARINQQLARSVLPGQFATLFMAEMDAIRGKVTYCNAGHEPPLYARAQARREVALQAVTASGPMGASHARAPADEPMETLDAGGIPLGLFPEASYESGTVAYGPGDLLLVFTDGATDAMNAGEESFTRERLGAELAQGVAQEWDAARLVRHLRAAIEGFTGARPQFDDLTLLAARRR